MVVQPLKQIRKMKKLDKWVPPHCACVLCPLVVSDSLWPYGQRSLAGSSVHRLLQARLLEWVAVPSFRESSYFGPESPESPALQAILCSLNHLGSLPHSWLQIKKKIIVLKYQLLLFCAMTMNHFLISLWCATNSVILYDHWWWPAQWLDREEAPKHFPKPNLHQKKVMVTVRWSAAHLINYSFLNPGKTITAEKYTQ